MRAGVFPQQNARPSAIPPHRPIQRSNQNLDLSLSDCETEGAAFPLRNAAPSAIQLLRPILTIRNGEATNPDRRI